VMIEAGANDIAFSSSCETDVSCYASKLSQVADNITAIVVRVRQLSARPSLAVVLLDYWNVWLGVNTRRLAALRTLTLSVRSRRCSATRFGRSR